MDVLDTVQHSTQPTVRRRRGAINAATRFDEDQPAAGMFSGTPERQADETGIDQIGLGLALLSPFVMPAGQAARTALRGYMQYRAMQRPPRDYYQEGGQHGRWTIVRPRQLRGTEQFEQIMEGMSRPNEVQVTYTHPIPEEARGLGYGSGLYRELVDWAHRTGRTAASDSIVSELAQTVWRSLMRRGYDVQIHPDAYRNKHGTAMTPDYNPVFRVAPNGPVNRWINRRMDDLGQWMLEHGYGRFAPERTQRDLIPPRRTPRTWEFEDTSTRPRRQIFWNDDGEPQIE